MEIIKKEKEEIKQGNSEIKEWTEEDDENIGDIDDPYYEL